MTCPAPTMPPSTKHRGHPRPAAPDVLLSVAAAISTGAILVTPTHSVGPYRIATSDSALWACLSKNGEPLIVSQEARRWVLHPAARRRVALGERIDILSSMELDSEWSRDWSAFAAARIFVATVGEQQARRALRRHEEGL